MTKVLLSLGSNLGDSIDILNHAIDDIKGKDGIKKVVVSPFYKTKPVGFLDQDDFVNLALSLETDINSFELLDFLSSLELKYKRVRLFKDGPRTLDIDIIAYGDTKSDDKKLTLPHPRMQDRAFVLAPLKDIEPDFLVTKFNQSIKELFDALPTKEKQDVKVING
ncbi:MAG: 2-amino-4-hydroxy-6-hydroxymethyldihydropteridine diphosphokinase [Succinivibrio sp.]|jgi:2-amino-4-hydroxy-6-hydroxymethyldihydropteridine diphosphokinase|nr:2-amino-4-hydroxy-6-hydroxymethyldihydropteridine diphosphokinase [Succinivibrio sp.]